MGDNPADNRRTRTRREVPHNIEAEESLLGSLMLTPIYVQRLEGQVCDTDFYKPAHAHIWNAMVALANEGDVFDSTTLAEELTRRDLLDHVGGRQHLREIESSTPASSNYQHYARIVVELAAYRALIRAGGDIVELGYTGAADDELSIPALIEKAHALVDNAQMPIGGDPSLNVGEFLATMQDDGDWCWPGVLRVMERLLLVAPEKYGKSTMLRQIAVLLSQGVDPFRPHLTIPSALVMLVDLENPRTMVQRKLGRLYDAMNTLEHQAIPETLRIDCRPEGVDLANNRADEMWLQERCAANRASWVKQGWEIDYPMVLCIGPVYQMLEDELSLVEVRRLQKAIDRIRKRFGCAVVMETHAPHESFNPKNPAHSLRPAGPRSWLRWPEFCRAFEPSTSIGAVGTQQLADFYDVMGARDERDWPRRLQRGGKIPWIEEQQI